MSKKEHRPEDLEESIEETAVIQCEKGKCTNDATVFCHYNPSEYFFNIGWRVIRNKVHCPDCASKVL